MDERNTGEREDALIAFRRAERLHRQGNHAEALALLDELDARYPGTKNLMYARAMCLAALGRLAEALEVCDALIVRFGAARAIELKRRMARAQDVPATFDPVTTPPPAAGVQSRPRRNGRRTLAVLGILSAAAAAVALLAPALLNKAPAPPPEVAAPPAPPPAPAPEVPPLAPESRQNLDLAQSLFHSGHWTRASAYLATVLQAHPDHPEVLLLGQSLRSARANFASEHGNAQGPTGVACLDSPGQTYELYIPPTALPENSAILYVFSPGGNGKEMLGWMTPAADAFGWIVAASNNSRNGPWPPILEAQDAVLRDTEERLSLHPTRRFATGFSGGARASLALAFRYPQRISGVLAMGAGWPINTNLQPSSRALRVCILIGNQDGNMRHDIPTTEQRLRRFGVQCSTVVYNGGHVKPPPEMILSACQWLNASGMY